MADGEWNGKCRGRGRSQSGQAGGERLHCSAGASSGTGEQGTFWRPDGFHVTDGTPPQPHSAANLRVVGVPSICLWEDKHCFFSMKRSGLELSRLITMHASDVVVAKMERPQRLLRTLLLLPMAHDADSADRNIDIPRVVHGEAAVLVTLTDCT